MKHAFTKGLFVAATATLIAACSTDDAADQMPVAPGKIEVSLKAALPQSRAQIEVDESNGRFSGSWEATDELTVYAEGSTSGEETPKFTYDADAKVFKGQLTNATQDWTYQAVYPAVDATPLNIPFGAERTQKGSNFNGAYDPLVSVPVTHVGAEPGKTPQGEAVTFGLNRLTAILALTFETDDATVKAEKVKSVALTAAGKTIAAKSFDITLGDQSGALNASGAVGDDHAELRSRQRTDRRLVQGLFQRSGRHLRQAVGGHHHRRPHRIARPDDRRHRAAPRRVGLTRPKP